jgi:hypothetical protein
MTKREKSERPVQIKKKTVKSNRFMMKSPNRGARAKAVLIDR